MITENRQHPKYTDRAVREAFEVWAGDTIKLQGCRWNGEAYTSAKVRTQFEAFCAGFRSGEQLTWEIDTAPEILLTWDTEAHKSIEQ